MVTPPPARACGPCNACCWFPALKELEKPAYELCDHASASGCAIYAERPRPCRDYSCLWLDGEFEDGDRPDAIGLAFDLPSLIEDHPDHAGVPVICARELWPDARQGERARELLTRLTGHFVVRTTAPGGKTQLTGPQRLVQLVAARAVARRAQEGGEPST